MKLNWLPTSLAAITLVAACVIRSHATSQTQPPLRKVEDIVIYQDVLFYSAFPSIVRRRDGELIVAFRRAPERRALGEKRTTHTDPNSYLVLVRSRDNGKSWSAEPELIYANPFGGSQDPCMVQLRDGTIVCTSYGWVLVQPDVASQLDDSLRHGSFAFMGGYLLQSKDDGRGWRGPFYPPPVGADTTETVFRKPVPAYNRGAMCQGKDGKLYWVVAANTSTKPRRTENHLLISEDKGETGSYSCPVATDPKLTFNRRRQKLSTLAGRRLSRPSTVRPTVAGQKRTAGLWLSAYTLWHPSARSERGMQQLCNRH